MSRLTSIFRACIAFLVSSAMLMSPSAAAAGWQATYKSRLPGAIDMLTIAISDTGDARIVPYEDSTYEVLVFAGAAYVISRSGGYVTLAETQELANDRRACCRFELPDHKKPGEPYRLPPRQFTSLGPRTIHGFTGIAYQRDGWRTNALDEADIVVSHDPVLEPLAGIFRPAGDATGFVFSLAFPHIPHFGNAPELHSGALLMIGPYELVSFQPHDWPEGYFNLPSEPLGLEELMDASGRRPPPPAPAPETYGGS